MSATASPPVPVAKSACFATSSVGQKVVLAVSGLVLFGFVVGHMLGNLQLYLPKHEGVWALDAYGKFLREMLHGGGIWVARGGLLLALVLHLWAAWGLSMRSLAARPVGYRQWQAKESTYASRTMRVTGPLLLLFVVYHLMHLTWGNAHPAFQAERIHENVVSGFREPLAAGVYVVAMLMLGLHLYHGVWSLLQSLGLSHPRYNPWRKCFASAVALVVVVGNCSFPISVLLGLVNS